MEARSENVLAGSFQREASKWLVRPWRTNCQRVRSVSVGSTQHSEIALTARGAHQEVMDRSRLERTSEQESLANVNSLSSEVPELILVFDSLGEGREFEHLSQLDQGMDNCGSLG